MHSSRIPCLRGGNGQCTPGAGYPAVFAAGVTVGLRAAAPHPLRPAAPAASVLAPVVVPLLVGACIGVGLALRGYVVYRACQPPAQTYRPY